MSAEPRFNIGDRVRHRASVDQRTGRQRRGAISYTVVLPADSAGYVVLAPDNDDSPLWHLERELYYVPLEEETT